MLPALGMVILPRIIVLRMGMFQAGVEFLAWIWKMYYFTAFAKKTSRIGRGRTVAAHHAKNRTETCFMRSHWNLVMGI